MSLRTWKSLAATCATTFAIAAASPAAAQTPPAMKLVAAPLVTPNAAWTFYGGGTTHSNGLAAWSDYTPEIKALARTLGAGRVSADVYAINVDNYILNNIAVEYRFGLGKGARGALIDQSGTPFDQAELMVKLLRYGGVSATYQMGAITLSANQFGLWSGLIKGLNPSSQSFTVDAKGACQFLADGGIPATVNGFGDCASATGDLTTVTLGHIWVSANGKLYDPSLKFHTLIGGVDLPAAMGCGSAGASSCGAQIGAAMMAGATTGSQAGATTLQGVNETSLKATLRTQAVALQNNLLSTDRFKRAVDLVGGKTITLVEAAPGATLPYPASAQASWTGDIPDQYRTTLSVTAPTCSATTFFADEIAARRLSYAGVGSTSGMMAPGFYLDGAAVTLSCGAGSQAARFVIDVAHPYAAQTGTYGDDHAVFDLVEPAVMRTGVWDAPDGPPSAVNKAGYIETSTVGSYPVTIVHAFGDASSSAQQFMSDLQTISPVMTKQTCRASSSTPVGNRTCENDRQPVAAETVSPLRTLSSRIVAGITGTAMTRHHDVGVIFASRNPGVSYASLQEVQSINSKTGDGAARDRAFEIEAATLPAVEGAAAADDPNLQVDASLLFLSRTGLDWGISGGSRIFMAPISAPKFIDVSPANMAAVLASLPDNEDAGGYLPWRKTRLQAAANAGYGAILNAGSDGEIFMSAGARAYTAWESLKGAAGSSDPVASALRTTELSDAAARRRKEMSASLADGKVKFEAEPDIVTGAGDFPYSLPFTRTFVGSMREGGRYSTSIYYGGAQPTTTINTYFTVRGGGDSDSHTRLAGGWTHNYNVTASITGNPAKGLAEDAALEGAATIAGIVALNDLFASPSFQNRVATAYVTNAIGASLYGNVIVVKKGAASETFFLLPDGSYAASGASSAKVVHTGFNWYPITYTGESGDVIQFTSSFMKGLYTQSTEAPAGNTPNFKADSWTFPDGVSLSFTYEWKGISAASSSGVYCTFAGSCNASYYISVGSILRKVSNNLGRSLTFTSNSVADIYSFVTDYRISSVTDENGRSATFTASCPPDSAFTCDVFTATTPKGDQTRYEYAADTASPDPTVLVGPNYRLRRWYTPGNLSTPYLTLAYDDLLRIRTVTDALGRQTQYFPGAVVGTERWKRAQTISPRVDVSEVSTTIFDDKNSPIVVVDPLSRTRRYDYDNAGRKVREFTPEMGQTRWTYDVRGNVLQTCVMAKSLTDLNRVCSAGAGDLISSSTYAEGPLVWSCTNPVTCNKPLTETDARSGVTNYEWDATTGNVSRILKPADAAGARPQADFGYTGYSLAGGVLSLLTSKTEKVSAAQALVTTYAYDETKGYVLKSATVDPTGKALRTCFQHDRVGNLIAQTDPRATACP